MLCRMVVRWLLVMFAAMSRQHLLLRVSFVYLMLVIPVAVHRFDLNYAATPPESSKAAPSKLHPLGDAIFLYSPGEVSDAVLKDARDILDVNWQQCKRVTRNSDSRPQLRCGPLPNYRESNGGFLQAKPIPWDRRRPISVFSEIEVTESYPIVDEKGDFVLIAYDAVTDLRTWVRLTTPGATFQPNEPVFDRVGLTGVGSKKDHFSFPVDPYYLLARESITLYLKPSTTSSSVILRHPYLGGHSCRTLMVIQQYAGFVRLGCLDSDRAGAEAIPLGWLPLRDEQGRFALWAVSYYC